MKFVLSLLLAAGTFALYWPSLNYAPFFDDVNSFEFGGIQLVFLNGFSLNPRWLPYFISAWIELLFESPLFVQRSFNVLLHLATAYVLYRLIRQVADHASPHPGNQRAALAAASLFLLHPLAVYAVGYLIQRTILMATLFGLMAIAAYFDGLTKRSNAFFIFSALFYFLSVHSKEHAVLVPLVALALTPLAGPVTRHTWRTIALPAVLYLAIAVFVVVRLRGLVGVAYEPFAATLLPQIGQGECKVCLWGLSALTQVALYFKYLGLMLLPNPAWMSIDMRVPFASSFLQPQYGFAVAALGAYVSIAVVWLMKGGARGVLAYALLAPFLLYGVEFSSVRVQEPFVLYRAYLWMPLLFLAFPVVTRTLSGRMFWSLLLLLALAFAWASSNRLQTFSSEFTLWDDAVKKLPVQPVLGVARVYANRGGQHMRMGAHADAIADFSRALNADPTYQWARKRRAIIYMRQKQYNKALSDVATMISVDPGGREAYQVRGQIYWRLGDKQRARADLTYGCAKTRQPNLCIHMMQIAATKNGP